MKINRPLIGALLCLGMAMQMSASAQVAFQEVSLQAGIFHWHKGFAYGCGAAAADFDGDGWIDLFIPGGQNDASRLYRNNGNWTFTDVADLAGVADDSSEGMGAVAADVDNDGDVDLYVTVYNGPNRLFLNQGGTFIEAGAAAGVDDPGPSTSAAMADYDNDGWLDIYVCNRDPNNKAIPNRLYRNLGNGTFQEVAHAAGVDYTGTPLAVAFFDYDNDGDQDLFVVNEFETDVLYRNNGDGSFTDVSSTAQIPLGEGMGLDFADCQSDGDLDVYISNYLDDFLLINHGNGTFSNAAAQFGMYNTSIGWGVNFLDYDNDGDRDLYVVNGVMVFLPRPEVNVFYENLGDTLFVNRAAQLGVADSSDGRGSLAADFDNDGYLDLFLVNVLRGRSRLYRNLGSTNHWITLRLEGTVSNRSAVGARVWLYAGGRRQMDEVRAGSSYASTHSLELEFGLGNATVVDSVVIRWPSGLRQRIVQLPVDQKLTIREGQSPTEVHSAQRVQPRQIQLLPAYPNPFNPETHIRVYLPRRTSIRLQVVDPLGRVIATLAEGMLSAGWHRFTWQGTDQSGQPVSSGIYLIVFTGGNQQSTQKIVLLR